MTRLAAVVLLVACAAATTRADGFRDMIRNQVAAPATTLPSNVPTFEAADEPLKLENAPRQEAEWLKAFAPPPAKFKYTVELIAEEETLRLYRLTFPSPFVSPWPQNNIVPAELYLPKKVDGKIPAAIVLDILDGTAIIARGMARGMAEQGVAALYVPMSCYGPRRPVDNEHLRLFQKDPSKAIDNVRQTVMDLRRAKCALATRPEIDPQRIGITGVSLGGIMTALTAGVDGTFYRVVPIMAGGDLPTIIFHARETRLLRDALQAQGVSQEQAKAIVDPIDPLSFAGRIDPRRCLMINAARDEVIPKETTEALARAIGQPQILWFPLGHYTAIFYLPNIRQRTIEYMQGKSVEKLDF